MKMIASFASFSDFLPEYGSNLPQKSPVETAVYQNN